MTATRQELITDPAVLARFPLDETAATVAYKSILEPQPYRATEFDGVDGYVETPNLFAAGDNFTLSFWTKGWTATTDSCICLQGHLSSGTSNFKYGALWKNDTLVFPYGDSQYTSQSETVYLLPAELDSINGSHVVFVCEGNAKRVYVDGVLVREISYDHTGEGTTVGNEFTIGKLSYATTWFYDGVISDLRTYDVSLTSEQREWVTTNGASGTAVPIANCLAHYKLDETGTIVYDSSGNANHGTRVGGATTYEGVDVPYSWQQQGFYSQQVIDGPTTDPAIAEIRAGTPVLTSTDWSFDGGDDVRILRNLDGALTWHLRFEVESFDGNFGIRPRQETTAGGSSYPLENPVDQGDHTVSGSSYITSTGVYHQTFEKNPGVSTDNFRMFLDRVGSHTGTMVVKNFELWSEEIYIPRDESDTDNIVLGNPLNPVKVNAAIARNKELADQPKRATEFDGVDGYVDLGTRSAPVVITISSWVYLDVGVSNARFVNFGRTILGISSSAVEWRPNLSADVSIATAAITAATWHHILMTQSGTDFELFVDGVFIATVTAGNINTAARQSNLGCYNTNSAFLNGKMLDTRIYNKSLSTDEQTFVRTFGTSGTDPTLINCLAWYKLDETGNVVYDSSGNGNHGIREGGVTTYEGVDVPFSWQELGFYREAFEPTETAIKLVESADLTGRTDSTITCRIKTTDNTGIVFGPSGTGAYMLHFNDGSGSSTIDVQAGSPTYTIDDVVFSGNRDALHTAIADGDWHDIEITGIDFSNANWSNGLYLGYSTNYFSGKIDNLMLDGIYYPGHFIPRDESDPTNDVLGNPLTPIGICINADPTTDSVAGLVNDSGTAIALDGVADYITSTPFLDDSTPFTVSFVAAASSYQSAAAGLAIKNGNADARSLVIYPYDDDSGDGARVHFDSGDIINIDGSTIPADGTAHHFTFVSRSSTEHELYVDGALVGTSSATAVLDDAPTELRIGDWRGASHFAGTLDEVIIANRDFSQTEVSVLAERPPIFEPHGSNAKTILSMV